MHKWTSCCGTSLALPSVEVPSSGRSSWTRRPSSVSRSSSPVIRRHRRGSRCCRLLRWGVLGRLFSGSFGWLIPFIAGAVIGVVAFLLLDSDRSVSEPEVELRATACETCGAEVMDEWRMCPHCGAMLDDGQRASRKEYRTRAIL